MRLCSTCGQKTVLTLFCICSFKSKPAKINLCVSSKPPPPIITEAEIRAAVKKTSGPDIAFAYLLGSAGTSRFHQESDVDLGVYWRKIPEWTKLNEIKNKLESLFKRDVDLVSLNTCDLIFSRQVLETGRLLFSDEPGLHLKWKAEQLSQYPDFKHSRKGIEENILNRKKYV